MYAGGILNPSDFMAITLENLRNMRKGSAHCPLFYIFERAPIGINGLLITIDIPAIPCQDIFRKPVAQPVF